MIHFIRTYWTKLVALVTIILGGFIISLKMKKYSKIVTSVPPERVKSDGSSIKLGESDYSGYVQQSSGEIKNETIFSDKNTVEVVEAEESSPITLPTGVENKDVQKLTRIKMNVSEVRNLDESSVNTEQLLEELSKL
jgi:hypothetical protein